MVLEVGVVAHEGRLVGRTRELVRADLVRKVEEPLALLARERLHLAPREDKLVVWLRPLGPDDFTLVDEAPGEQTAATDGTAPELHGSVEA